MIFAHLIDLSGNFLEDVFCTYNDDGTATLSDGRIVLRSQIVEPPCPPGFYLPKWNGSAWVEGGTAPDTQPTEPTTDERLASVEAAITALMGV